MDNTSGCDGQQKWSPLKKRFDAIHQQEQYRDEREQTGGIDHGVVVDRKDVGAKGTVENHKLRIRREEIYCEAGIVHP